MANNLVFMESVFVSNEKIFQNFWRDLQITFKLDKLLPFPLVSSYASAYLFEICEDNFLLNPQNWLVKVA